MKNHSNSKPFAVQQSLKCIKSKIYKNIRNGGKSLSRKIAGRGNELVGGKVNDENRIKMQCPEHILSQLFQSCTAFLSSCYALFILFEVIYYLNLLHILIISVLSFFYMYSGLNLIIVEQDLSLGPPKIQDPEITESSFYKFVEGEDYIPIRAL